MPVKVSCHAVFSQFTIVPNHGLNFGPMVYNSESNPNPNPNPNPNLNPKPSP